MHEMAIAQGILDITLDTAARADAAKVTGIRLSIGQMTQVEPEALRFCFAALATGTLADGAALEIAIVPLVAYCRDCEKHFSVERFRFLCPACGSAGLELISGRELRVEHLEVD